jgi:Flp pilus assembly protein TadD
MLEIKDNSGWHQRAKVAAVAAVLAAATTAAYWKAPSNGFTCFDDSIYITDNTYVLHGLTWQGLKWSLTTFHASNWHPLTWISMMADTTLLGPGAFSHHLVNVALHIGCALLLLGLLLYATGRLWESAFVAGLFALHPLHVESVAWASERKDVLSTFFFLATVWMHFHYARRPGPGRYALVLILFGLGLASKPMLVTLPFVLLLLDRWPLERLWWDRAVVTRLAMEKLPLLAMAVVSSAVTLKAQKAAMSSHDMASRLTNAIVSYGVYIRQMLWPEGLAVLYAHPGRPLYALAFLTFVLLAAITIAVLYFSRRRRYLFVGWFFYIGTLVPVIGIVQVGSQAHADRYTYIPLIGLFIIVAWLAGDMSRQRPRLKSVFAWAGVVVLIAAAAATYRTVGYWKDDVLLFGHAVEAGQRNSGNLGNLGAALGMKGDFKKGEEYLRKALEMSPNDMRVLTSISVLMLNSGRLKESEELHMRALRLDSSNREANAGMALTLVKLGRPQEALPYGQKVVEIDPIWPYGYDVVGMALADMGRLDESQAAFAKAVDLNPTKAQFYNNLATVYTRKGDVQAAIEIYKRGLAAEPGNPDGLASLRRLTGGQ